MATKKVAKKVVKKEVKKVPKKKKDESFGGEPVAEVIEMVNQINSKKMRGVVFVATFGKKKGDIADFKSITNKTTVGELGALLHTIAETADIASDLAQRIAMHEISKILE